MNVSDENVIRSVSVSWYLNQNKALIGQDPKEFEKNCRVFVEREQPLIPVRNFDLILIFDNLFVKGCKN